jgi:hypothetical protein
MRSYKNAPVFFVISVRLSACNKSKIAKQIFMKCYIEEFTKIRQHIEILVKNRTPMTDSMHEDVQAFVCISSVTR